MSVYAELVKIGLSNDAAGEITQALTRTADAVTKQDLALSEERLLRAVAELKADLFKHTTDTLIRITAIYATIVLVELALFAFAVGRLIPQ